MQENKNVSLQARVLANKSVCLSLTLGLALTFAAASPSWIAYARDSRHVKSGEVKKGTADGDRARAECGLKLLINIFTRLGSEPQLALKDQMQPRSGDIGRVDKRQLLASSMQSASSNMDDAGLGGAVNQLANNTDPALAIRPQSSRRPATQKNAQAKGVAMDATIVAMAQSDMRQSNKIVAKPVSESKAAAAPAPMVVAQAEPAEISIPYLAGSTRGSIVPLQDKNHIRDIKSEGSAQLAEESANRASQSIGGSKEVTFDSDSSIIRPSEQPGLFKYVREHKNTLPTDTPKDAAQNSFMIARAYPDAAGQAIPVQASAAPVANARRSRIPSKQKFEQSQAVNLKKSSLNRDFAPPPPPVVLSGKNRLAGLAGSNIPGAPAIVAFQPPSTIRGINGLALGCPESEVTRFFKARGTVKVTVSHGWQILSLIGSDKSIFLQAYLHNGTTEALRVFDQSFVPLSIGVNLNDDLTSMKSKFGEPSFILEEPKMPDGGPATTGKNYVYPLSQLGFQLARPASGGTPQIKSLFLFRYL